jgi:4-amino-4-deoxy-L-arabinose transferase-like glycosyltransferase
MTNDRTSTAAASPGAVAFIDRVVARMDGPIGWFVAAAISLGSLALRLFGLGRGRVGSPDEACHLTVARNFLRDPTTPALFSADRFGPECADWLHPWQTTHVWLHKPPMAMWQAAFSSWVLDSESVFALRLPSAILAAATVFVVFAIGRELVGGVAGLTAAAALSATPSLQTLVGGRLFSDAVDVSLLFWTTVGVYFVARATRTGAYRDAVFAGVACGFAYLSKYFLAGIVPGVALVAWIAGRVGFAPPERARFRFPLFAALIAAALVAAGPWIVRCAWSFPIEWRREQAHALSHLGSNVERWGGPSGRVLFGYSIFLLDAFVVPAFVAACVATTAAVAKRRFGVVLLGAWFAGVLIPHLFATSKTPSATLPGAPAALLLFGVVVRDAVRGRPFALGAILGLSAVAVFASPDYYAFFFPVQDVDSPPWAPNVRWMTFHAAAAIVGGVALVGLDALARRAPPPTALRARSAFRVVATIAALAGVAYMGSIAARGSIRVARTSAREGSVAAFGADLRRRLPENAVVCFDRADIHVALRAMFYSGRDCATVPKHKLGVARATLASRGAVPYRATRDPSRPDAASPAETPGARPSGVAFFDEDSGLSVVPWPDPAASRPSEPRK